MDVLFVVLGLLGFPRVFDGIILVTVTLRSLVRIFAAIGARRAPIIAGVQMVPRLVPEDDVPRTSETKRVYTVVIRKLELSFQPTADGTGLGSVVYL